MRLRAYELFQKGVHRCFITSSKVSFCFTALSMGYVKNNGSQIEYTGDSDDQFDYFDLLDEMILSVKPYTVQAVKSANIWFLANFFLLF